MAAALDREQFLAWLRTEFPRLLQEDPDFGARVLGILTQTLSSKADLQQVLEEIRRLREDFNRRFEATEHRFEAAERRFEAVERRLEELREDFNRRFEAAERRFEAIERTLVEHSRALRELRVGLGSLGRRFGRGFEEAVRATVEEFAGVRPLKAERLVLRDERGELFGIPGQAVEFDAFVHEGRRFLVEVKAYADPEDVLHFHRKLEFAAKVLQEPFERVLIAPYALPRTRRLAESLGIRVLPPEEPLPEEE